MATKDDMRTMLTAMAGMAAGALVFSYLSDKNKAAPQEKSSGEAPAPSPAVLERSASTPSSKNKNMTPTEARSKSGGLHGRWTKPVVISSPALEDLAKLLRKRLGGPEYTAEQGETVYIEKFKSGDVNAKFNWERVIGRKVVMLFDTVDQTRFFEQLSLLQALQGFAVPDSDDKTSKWKTYVSSGKYSWGRASSITVVLPWYRPCQMERTSRWQFDGQTGKWTNGDPNGEWLDVPCALYYARLLSTPGSVPPLPGPSEALDGMPLEPLWRPPLELVFVELHEEQPVSHAVTDLNTDIRMVRYVPYFLDKYKSKKSYVGKANMYVLFPDHGAFDRYGESVAERLKLDPDHILFIQKTRVGEQIQQSTQLLWETPTEKGEKTTFKAEDGVLIIDDFTNSGSTLLGAVDIIKGKTAGGGQPQVDIFVSHLVALYDEKVVRNLQTKLHALGEKTRMFVTNSIPLTTNLLKDDPQVEVCDLSDFIADIVCTRG